MVAKTARTRMTTSAAGRRTRGRARATARPDPAGAADEPDLGRAALVTRRVAVANHAGVRTVEEAHEPRAAAHRVAQVVRLAIARHRVRQRRRERHRMPATAAIARDQRVGEPIATRRPPRPWRGGT